MVSELPVMERRLVTLLDPSLTILAAAALAAVGITLVSGPTEGPGGAAPSAPMAALAVASPDPPTVMARGAGD